MISFKKKLLAGLLSGAILFTGGLAMNDVQAAEKTAKNVQQTDVKERHERPQLTEEQINEAAKNLATKYGVNQNEVATALKNRVHFGDIEHAAVLAKLSGKSFSEVLAMKCDWWEVAEKLGVTHEQFEALMKEEMISDLAKDSNLDKKTVESFLNDNYDPHDIFMAGIIAKESGKNAKTVMSKRKINNTWDDVAKEFNVDLHKVMEKYHEPKGKMRGENSENQDTADKDNRRF